MTGSSKYSVLIAVLFSIGFVFSCHKSDFSEIGELEDASDDNPSISEVSEDSVVSPAVITFLTGEVLHTREDSSSIPEIGDSLLPGDMLETGSDGYAELQFGNLGVLRIQPDSMYRLDILMLEQESEKVSGFMGMGSLVAKIRHLREKDGFEVNIPGAVCAVRGTEFLIRSDERGSVTIAVADGSVAVSPPSMAEVGNPSITPDVEGDDDLSVIRSLMPLVTKDKEIVITSDTLAEVEAAISDFRTSENDEENNDARESPSVLLESGIRDIIIKTPLPEPEPIGPANAEILETETPEILPASYSTDDDEKPLLSDLVTVTVTVDPGNAQIFINNRPAGRGQVSQLFPEGSRLRVKAVSLDGRVQEKELTAGSESPVSFLFTSAEDSADIEPERTEAEEPEDSGPEKVEILSEVSIASSAPADPVPESSAESVPQSREVVLQVIVKPDDAAVSFNGQPAGTGSVEYKGISGDRLSVKVTKPGFNMFSRVILPGPGAEPLRVELEPKPVVSMNSLPVAPVVGSLISEGNIVFGAAGDGTVFALGRNGRLLWSQATENRDEKDITPVLFGRRVYLIGKSELLVMNPADGTILGRRELRGDQAALFGRRVLAWDKYLILPTDSALIFLNTDNISENGKSVVSLNIPNGSRMTPAFWNNRIIIVDQRGNLLYIDPVTKSISRSISTEARQPIGQAPAISGNTAVFSGRLGVVVAVDLERAEVLWSQPLNNSGAVKVHTDALIHDGIVYLYGENVLYALNLADGKYVFPPVSGVSAAPEIVDNVLYLCRDNGIITIHNPRSGEYLGEFELNENCRSRPVGLGPFLVAAAEEHLFVLDPRSMTD